MSAALSAGAFEILAGFVKARSGIALGPDKTYLLETRLAPILRRERLADLNALAARLKVGAPETLCSDVVEAMTTNESLFFRDQKPFAHLRDRVLPELVKAAAPGPVRVWSAAASTGQEAYSVAMVASEPEFRGGRAVEIVGTDIAREALSRARAGLYSQFEVQRGLPVQMLMKHFRKEEGGWQVSDALRAMTRFQEANLLGDLRGLGRFEVVFCRNVLIYFDPPTKARVLRGIAGQMLPGAVLYLGGAESAAGLDDCFAPIPGERCTYRRV